MNGKHPINNRRRGIAVAGKSKAKGAEVRKGWCILGTTKMPTGLESCEGQKRKRGSSHITEARKPWHEVWLI